MNNYDELYHYGVPGMKWGVRRDSRVKAARKKYRDAYLDYSRAHNKHSRTYFGKNRRQKTYDNMMEKYEISNKAYKDYKETKAKVKDELIKKNQGPDISKMSDAELRQKINRIQMEKQYKQLTEKDVNKGKNYVNTAIKMLGTTAAVTSSIITLDANSHKLMELGKKYLGL